MSQAVFVTEVTVTDPDSGMPVEVSIYKDTVSGGLFGVDTSYVLSLGDEGTVIEPFNGQSVLLLEP